jgi:hypothetical protein
MLARILTLVACLGCAAVPLHSSAPAPSGALAPDLPAPTGPLSVPGSDASYRLIDLVLDFGRVTDQLMLMSEATREQLMNESLQLGPPTEIPAQEVYEFVEGVLVFHGFVIAPLKGGTEPVMGVFGPSGRQSYRIPRLHVEEKDLPRYARHPALIVTTTVFLENTDVRQLSTSLRGVLTDTNTQTLLPMGSGGLMLSGTGRFVAQLVEMLRGLDAFEAHVRSRAEGPSDAERAGGAR